MPPAGKKTVENPLAGYPNAPKRFRCSVGNEWKDAECFSKRQLAAVVYKLSRGQPVEAHNTGMKCIAHSSASREEMTCRGPCNRILALKEFSKNARKTTEWCMQCTTWKELQCQGVTPWAVAHHQVTPDEKIVVSHLSQPAETFVPKPSDDAASVIADPQVQAVQQTFLPSSDAAGTSISGSVNTNPYGNGFSFSYNGLETPHITETASSNGDVSSGLKAPAASTAAPGRHKYVPTHLRSAAPSATSSAAPSGAQTPSGPLPSWSLGWGNKKSAGPSVSDLTSPFANLGLSGPSGPSGFSGPSSRSGPTGSSPASLLGSSSIPDRQPSTPSWCVPQASRSPQPQPASFNPISTATATKDTSAQGKRERKFNAWDPSGGRHRVTLKSDATSMTSASVLPPPSYASIASAPSTSSIATSSAKTLPSFRAEPAESTIGSELAASEALITNPASRGWAKGSRVPVALDMPVGGYHFENATYDTTGNDDESDDGFY